MIDSFPLMWNVMKTRDDFFAKTAINHSDEQKENSPGKGCIESKMSFLKHKKDIVLIMVLVATIFILRWHYKFPSVWEWDSALFAQGILDYNIRQHHPHPPGFPYYIGLGKLFHLFIDSPDRALIFLSVFFGSLVGIPMYQLFRHYFDRTEAFLGSLLVQFCPVVWFMGERAMSDSVALFWLYLFALLFLPFKTFSPRKIIGLITLAVCLGVRPQLLIHVTPLVCIAAIQFCNIRQWKACLSTIIIFIAGNTVWLLIVIHNLGGFSEFFDFCFSQTSHLIQSESVFHIDNNYSIDTRFRRFFIYSWGDEWIGYLILSTAFIGLVWDLRRKANRQILLLTVGFFPALLFMLVFNNPYIIRYTIPFIPIFVFYSIRGLIFLTRRKKLVTVGLSVLIIYLGIWMHEALSFVCKNPLPLQQIVQDIRSMYEGTNRNVTILTDPHFIPLLKYMLSDTKYAIQDINNYKSHCDNSINMGQVLYISELEPDIGLFCHNRAAIPSRKFKRLSRSRYLQTYLILNPVIPLCGWSNLYNDSKLKKTGRMIENEAQFLFYGKGSRNILDIEATVRGDWSGAPPQLVLTIGQCSEQHYSIGKREFHLSQFFQDQELPDDDVFVGKLHIASPQVKNPGQKPSLFITSIRWRSADS